MLRIADTVVSAYPNAKFYVSEIASDPDPFLAVSIGTNDPDQPDGSRKFFVIAVWDEPGFSG